jgi:hypothetical protein
MDPTDRPFQKQLAEIEKAKNEGLIRPVLILPPLLNNGEKTDTYRWGEATTMKDKMGLTNFVSRASLADLCLRLGEKAAAKIKLWYGRSRARRVRGTRAGL